MGITVSRASPTSSFLRSWSYTLDAVISISDGDSILTAKKLARNLGLGVGISWGCNFRAAVHAQQKLGGDAIVATVFVDDNRKYLTTDLLRDKPTRDGFLAPEIELKRFRVLPPVNLAKTARKACGCTSVSLEGVLYRQLRS